MPKKHPLPLVSSLRSVLSPEAIDVFEALALTRDPDWTVPPPVLSQLLARRELPVLDCALLFEELAGGTQLSPAAHWGTFAALRDCEAQEALPAGQFEWLGGNAPRRYDGFHLPTGKRTDWLPLMWKPVDEMEVWVDARGAVYLVDPDDDFGGEFEAFDSIVQYLEVFALLGGQLPLAIKGLSSHQIWIFKGQAEEWARLLDLSPFAPATGTYVSAWKDQSLSLFEQRIQGYPHGIRAVTLDIEVALAIVREAASQRLDFDWFCPDPQALLGPYLPPAFQRFREKDGDYFRWGAPPAPYFRPRH